MEIQGSHNYPIRSSDGKLMRRHADHIRSTQVREEEIDDDSAAFSDNIYQPIAAVATSSTGTIPLADQTDPAVPAGTSVSSTVPVPVILQTTENIAIVPSSPTTSSSTSTSVGSVSPTGSQASSSARVSKRQRKKPNRLNL